LDLGAIAKGFAVDLVIRALDGLSHVAVDAGGDGYYRGMNAAQHPWRVGIRAAAPDDTHPPRLAATIDVQDAAVCTSGDYLRRGIHNAPHLLDPRQQTASSQVRSVSVCAANAALADGLATAAFVLGPEAAAPMLADEEASAFFQMADGSHHTIGAEQLLTAWTILSPACSPSSVGAPC
jgi:thiamine biosynthesis lipoprotein